MPPAGHSTIEAIRIVFAFNVFRCWLTAWRIEATSILQTRVRFCVRLGEPNDSDFGILSAFRLTPERHLLVKTGESPEGALSVHRDTAPLTPLHGRARRSFKVRFLNLSSKPCAVG